MLSPVLVWLAGLPRAGKRLLQLSFDCVLLLASFTLAMALRLDSFYFLSLSEPWIAFGVTLPLTLLIFIRTGFYRAITRYISTRALKVIFLGVFASSVILFAVSQTFGLFVPRSVPGIYAMLAFLSVGGTRFFLRELFFRRQQRMRAPVLIYGAGMSGRNLAAVLNQGFDYTPIAYVDEDDTLIGQDVAGLRVFSPDLLPKLIADHGISLVLLAIPRASRSRRREIIDQLAELSVRVETIPDMDDIISGRAKISEIREVEPEDLLGRDPVPPEAGLMGANITGQCVMVTGAGGSIGSELCRQILNYGPKALILFEQSEPALYQIETELRDLQSKDGSGVRIISLLASVQNPRRVASVIERHSVDTIYHAAAYKHVPLVEKNVVEGLRNNVFGTHTLLTAALSAGVGAFILISTDKAVRPTSIMGASKRMAELVCQAHAVAGSETTISMVRFGNVLGSSGSVIPRFRDQIESGGPVTVTHPDITRYFMSIPEAAQLVIQAGAMAKGGDVFLLDMGNPVRITDLADRMVRLSGLVPYIAGTGDTGDIEILFTSLRPGEKLYEELLIDDTAQKTDHPRILTANERCIALTDLEKILAAMLDASVAQDVDTLRRLLLNSAIDFRPENDCMDASEDVTSARQVESTA